MKNFFTLALALVLLAMPAAARTMSDYVDDELLRRMFLDELKKLNEKPDKVSLATLQSQLSRTGAVVKLMRTRSSEREWPDIRRRVEDSVFIVGELYKCRECTSWHALHASGFVISEDGALVTNHHVVQGGTGAVMGAMNLAGDFFPVTAVLAANKAEDVAILKLAGDKFEPLPLLADKPVGSAVAVLSHPNKAFYSFTTGIISRYNVQRIRSGSKTRQHNMVITADYAKGSSGAPVFDNCGNVVGLASSTESVYYKDDHGKQESLQQVFKFCVPASFVLDLIREP